jgi:hypothetical protein
MVLKRAVMSIKYQVNILEMSSSGHYAQVQVTNLQLLFILPAAFKEKHGPDLFPEFTVQLTE